MCVQISNAHNVFKELHRIIYIKQFIYVDSIYKKRFRNIEKQVA